MRDLLTIPELSARTGIPQRTLLGRIKAGHLRAESRGGMFWISARDAKKMAVPRRGRPVTVDK